MPVSGLPNGEEKNIFLTRTQSKISQRSEGVRRSEKNWWGTEWSIFFVVLQSLIIRDNRLQNDYTKLGSMVL